MKDFVTFELAKKLKEKGFNEVCYNYYEPLKHCPNQIKTPWTNKEGESYGVITAPTISQVLKWLREEKKVDLVIEPIFIYDENKHREYGVRVFAPQLNKPVNCGYFNMWNDASIAGIEYVIDNLI